MGYDLFLFNNKIEIERFVVDNFEIVWQEQKSCYLLLQAFNNSVYNEEVIKTFSVPA